jgi:glycosyltransferase involved in cell wall biosynthesis
MKTVVINALSALQGGGQTYLQNLISCLNPRDNLKVFIITHGAHSSLFAGANIEVLSPEFPSKSIIHRFLWEKFRLPSLLKKLHADVFYCPGGIISMGNVGSCKIAAAFQNMLPFAQAELKRYPFGYMRFRLYLLRFLQLRSFRKADLIIFISDYAQAVMDKLIPLRKGRSVVIHHGIGAQFFRDERMENSPLPYEYVLYVSYIDVYKNQLEAIEAWKYLKEMRNTHEKLVLAGPASASYLRKVEKRIRDCGLNNDVVYLGNVKYDDLPIYYRSAKVNIFASSCENCPYILLEAMAAGRPLFCSNHMPMPEFAGDAAVYFNPYNSRELAELLVRYLDDKDFLGSLGKAAYERSLLYNSCESAKKTWNALLALAD